MNDEFPLKKPQVILFPLVFTVPLISFSVVVFDVVNSLMIFQEPFPSKIKSPIIILPKVLMLLEYKVETNIVFPLNPIHKKVESVYEPAMESALDDEEEKITGRLIPLQSRFLQDAVPLSITVCLSAENELASKNTLSFAEGMELPPLPPLLNDQCTTLFQSPVPPTQNLFSDFK